MRQTEAVLTRRALGRVTVPLLLTLIATSVGLVPARAASAKPAATTRVTAITIPVVRTTVQRLRFEADHVALYWSGHPDAAVTVAFSRDGVHFGRTLDVGRDEVGEQRANGVTYGAVLTANRAAFVRVTTNRALSHLTVLGLADRVRALVDKLLPNSPVGGAHPAQPPIVARSGWGADESLRFNSNGSEKWPPAFAPVQKLIVHHTAGANNDRNPAATIRAIYYYHAVTQGWGDIGYNFLIDEAGRIYKGRDSHAKGSTADTITGEDASGNGVTGAHAHEYNSGTVGVALLGTLTNQDATPAAKRALEDLLAWKADTHGIDPHGSSRYTNPVGGNQKVFANIAGHRDVGTTACPGGAFYAGLPEVRDQVAARMGK